MIRPGVVVAGTDPCSDPSSLSALLCESRDGMLIVSLWLLRSRIAQFMAAAQSHCAVHGCFKQRYSRRGKMREREICRHSALQNDTFWFLSRRCHLQHWTNSR